MNISEAIEAEEADEDEKEEENRAEKKATEPFFATTTIMLRSTSRLRNRSSRVSYSTTTKCLKKCLSLPCQLSECTESRNTSSRNYYYYCDQETTMSAAVVDFGPSRKKGYFYESVGGVYYTLGELMNYDFWSAITRKKSISIIHTVHSVELQKVSVTLFFRKFRKSNVFTA